MQLLDDVSGGRDRLRGSDGALHAVTPILLLGQSQQTLALSGTAAQTAAVTPGRYAVWCDEARAYLKLALAASDVTTATGFPVFQGNMIIVTVPPGGYKLGAITSGTTGTLRFHRV